MSNFVHLHNHTDFSLLDAAQSIKIMLDRVEELGMDSIAVTEHGNLFSMLPFYKAAKARNIKPILGCEVYVAVGSRTEKKQITDGRSKKWGYHHLVLLVQNNQGYRNLLKLVSKGYLEGFYYRPRVDKELLRKYNEGLIASSACLAGEIPSLAAKGDYEGAKRAALEYSEIFPGRFYLELQNHNIPEELDSHEILIRLSKELNIPLIATNDNHYAREEHWEAHDILFCLGSGKDRDDPKRQRYAPRQFYIKSADEMYALFRNTPEALENTLSIAEQCNADIPLGEYFLPKYHFPSDAGTDDADQYLRRLCMEGIRKRYRDVTPEMTERMDFELGVIGQMGFAGYFLITADFVQFAHDHQIPVGPGRGSAAGSLVAYATGITNVDPLEYNLLFERFLNPNRVSMPDIDIDFCVEGRQRVIDYIKEQYGHESVCQIITFGRMKAKLVVRDVGRVLGMSYGEVDRIAKLIPGDPKINIAKASEINKELAHVADIDDIHRQLMEYSKVLEGLHRHVGTHAAGVVIAPGPLTDYVPLYKAPGTDDITTQVEMTGLEEMGLLKVDFLGLRNLTVIDKTMKMIEKNHGVKLDMDRIALDDADSYRLFAEGRTVGVFQFESGGMREYLKQLNPSCIADLIAMNALYRPGPMQNIPDFIARKNGRQQITYPHPGMEPILKETYGIIVYQEQVMQLGSEIAGFTLAQADQMRRAMGKKKPEVMAAFKVDFVNGAGKRGLSAEKATEIFDLVERFAKYGFNKSHSTAYALVAYQTAWLKTHYPHEFMAANMNSEMDNMDRIVILVNEAREMGIEVLPPDVNTSCAEFIATSDGKIAYGLAAIKNVGTKAAEAVGIAREKKGHFETLFDLLKNTDYQNLNRKVLESLILAGACDSLEGHRAQKFEIIEPALKFAQQYHQAAASSQVDLFGGSSAVIQSPELPATSPWNEEQCLTQEKELLGFFLSGNPLTRYIEDIKEFTNVDLSLKEHVNLPKAIRFGGIITEMRQLYDRENNPWAICTIMDMVGKADVFIFAKVFEQVKDRLKTDEMVFIQGRKSDRNDDGESLKILAEEVVPMDNARRFFSHNVNIRMTSEMSDAAMLDRVKQLADDNKGRCSMVFHLMGETGGVQRIRAGGIGVTCAPEFISSLRDILGRKNVWLN